MMISRLYTWMDRSYGRCTGLTVTYRYILCWSFYLACDELSLKFYKAECTEDHQEFFLISRVPVDLPVPTGTS